MVWFHLSLKLLVVDEGVDSLVKKRFAEKADETVACIRSSEVEEHIEGEYVAEGRGGSHEKKATQLNTADNGMWGVELKIS